MTHNTRQQQQKQQQQQQQQRHLCSTESHYDGKTAEVYEDAFFYEPGAYMENLRTLVQDRLQLKEQKEPCRLLDIGGGTGSFTRKIVQDTLVTGVVVDPFLDQSSSDNDDDDAVCFVKASAEAFKHPPGQDSSSSSSSSGDDDDCCWRTTPFHFVLMKEVVHHLDDRVAIFKGMREGMMSSHHPATMLIITRPQKEIDYPLWDAARDVWAENQPSLEELVSDIRAAGFRDIQHTVERYPCSIDFARWKAMVKRRFWSTFSNFTDEELEQACVSIEEAEKDRIAVDGSIAFEDRLIFISAKKK